MSFLESLNNFDHTLFLKIHHFRNDFLDAVMPFMTSRGFWIPLYAILLFIIWRRFGKQTIMIAVTITVLILITDQTCNLMKNSICRERPCYDVILIGQVITPVGCGGQYGFVSGHAANSFAVATFLWLLSGISKGVSQLKRRHLWLLLFPWAIVISWSRIYVGVHFPFDLIVGGLIGAVYAVMLFILYRKVVPVLK